MGAKIGEPLLREHGLSAQKGYYRRDGKWYNRILHFPVVLFDLNGYIEIKKEEELNYEPFRHKAKLHVDSPGISGHPRYWPCGHRHS